MNVGRTLLVSAAAFTAAGGFLFDWNKTHLFNPNWPPHAKFHDAMTIMQGALLGSSSLILLAPKEAAQQKQLLWGALLPSFFWVSMAGSFAFPGAKGLEAEFPEKVIKVGRLKINEGMVSGFMLIMLGLGYALAKKIK